MKNIIFLISIIVFISCNSQNQSKKGNDIFELGDSKESYVIEKWDDNTKKEYYKLLNEVYRKNLKISKFNYLNDVTFKTRLEECFNINFEDIKHNIPIPFHIFDKNDDYRGSNQIVFLENNVLHLRYPHVDVSKKSMDILNDKDYVLEDGSLNNTVVFNKIIFNQKDKLLDELLNNTYESDIYNLQFLVVDLHYSCNQKVLNYVVSKIIKEIENQKNRYDSYELMKLLSFRDKYEIDIDFVTKIKNIDKKKVLYPLFSNAIDSVKEEIGEETAEKFKYRLNIIYNSSFIEKEILKKYKHDINNDGILDQIVITKSLEEQFPENSDYYYDNNIGLNRILHIFLGNRDGGFRQTITAINCIPSKEDGGNAEDSFLGLSFVKSGFSIHKVSIEKSNEGWMTMNKKFFFEYDSEDSFILDQVEIEKEINDNKKLEVLQSDDFGSITIKTFDINRF
ncbi:hypothetical protein ACSTS3_16940 [Aquimarina muelleri]|uniref:hypothetical protein n=1 Tax=Aquimarina muelleri TaxID=279356 RepID=UPI003F6883C1